MHVKVIVYDGSCCGLDLFPVPFGLFLEHDQAMIDHYCYHPRNAKQSSDEPIIVGRNIALSSIGMLRIGQLGPDVEIAGTGGLRHELIQDALVVERFLWRLILVFVMLKHKGAYAPQRQDKEEKYDKVLQFIAF
jgi:hypothetical protein